MKNERQRDLETFKRGLDARQQKAVDAYGRVLDDAEKDHGTVTARDVLAAVKAAETVRAS